MFIIILSIKGFAELFGKKNKKSIIKRLTTHIFYT